MCQRDRLRIVFLRATDTLQNRRTSAAYRIFRVFWPLFSHAEVGEDVVEDFVGGDLAGDFG